MRSEVAQVADDRMKPVGMIVLVLAAGETFFANGPTVPAIPCTSHIDVAEQSHDPSDADSSMVVIEPNAVDAPRPATSKTPSGPDLRPVSASIPDPSVDAYIGDTSIAVVVDGSVGGAVRSVRSARDRSEERRTWWYVPNYGPRSFSDKFSRTVPYICFPDY
jgi:hypothetical protein